MAQQKQGEYRPPENLKSSAEVLELHRAISAVIHSAENRITQRRAEFEHAKQCGSRITQHRFSY